MSYVRGSGRVGFQRMLGQPLDELIHHATALALEDAAMRLDDVDAVCMASSDLLDGRAISTMTLTAATGSFGKSELRVCDDGLGALAVAQSEIESGAAETVLVSSWTKLSEADSSAIYPLGAEPIFHRPLGFDGEVVLALRRSRLEERATTVDIHAVEGADGAVALVLTRHADGRTRQRIVGTGWSTGSYLSPADDPLAEVGVAAARALRDAGRQGGEVARVRCAAFHHVADEELVQALGLGAEVPVLRSQPVGLEVGYAAGLFAVTDALVDSEEGFDLIVGHAGLGLQSAYAALFDGGR